MLDRVHLFDAETGSVAPWLTMRLRSSSSGAGVMGSAMTLPGGAAAARASLWSARLSTTQIIRSVARQRPASAARRHAAGQRRGASAGRRSATSWPAHRASWSSACRSAGVDWAIERIVESVQEPLADPDDHQGPGARARARSRCCRASSPARSSAAPGMALPVMAVGGPCIAGELAAARDTSVVVTGTRLRPRRAHARPARGALLPCAGPPTTSSASRCAPPSRTSSRSASAARRGSWSSRGKAANGAQMHNLPRRPSRRRSVK